MSGQVDHQFLTAQSAGVHIFCNDLQIYMHEGRAKSSRTFLITLIIDARLVLYFHKCILSIFLQNVICQILFLIG